METTWILVDHLLSVIFVGQLLGFPDRVLCKTDILQLVCRTSKLRKSKPSGYWISPSRLLSLLLWCCCMRIEIQRKSICRLQSQHRTLHLCWCWLLGDWEYQQMNGNSICTSFSLHHLIQRCFQLARLRAQPFFVLTLTYQCLISLSLVIRFALK